MAGTSQSWLGWTAPFATVNGTPCSEDIPFGPYLCRILTTSPSFLLPKMARGSLDHSDLRTFGSVRRNSWKWSHLHGNVTQTFTTPFWALDSKLCTTASALKAWSRTLFSNFKVQHLMALDVILDLDVAQESRALSERELHL